MRSRIFGTYFVKFVACLHVSSRIFKMVYSKILKTIKPKSLYFSKALFEGLIFGGAYIWRGLLIGLASRGKEIYNFFFILLCI